MGDREKSDLAYDRAGPRQGQGRRHRDKESEPEPWPVWKVSSLGFARGDSGLVSVMPPQLEREAAGKCEVRALRTHKRTDAHELEMTEFWLINATLYSFTEFTLSPWL